MPNENTPQKDAQKPRNSPVEGSSTWYSQHAERLTAAAANEANPGKREELKRAALRFRVHATNAADAEKKRAERALALKIR